MSKSVKKYVERIEAALEAANTGTTKLTEAEFALEGMSSRKNRILMNELIKDGDRYLEIGVYKGSTFVAANYKNTPRLAVAIDNFSQFDPGGQNSAIFKKVTVERDITNFTLLNADCFNIPKNLEEHILGKNFNVYFYDGGHTLVDHYKALYYYYLTLSDRFIYIVDDWNHEPARQGTADAIRDLKIKVHKEWELRSDKNGDTGSWWNGLYIAILEKTQ